MVFWTDIFALFAKKRASHRGDILYMLPLLMRTMEQALPRPSRRLRPALALFIRSHLALLLLRPLYPLVTAQSSFLPSTLDFQSITTSLSLGSRTARDASTHGHCQPF